MSVALSGVSVASTPRRQKSKKKGRVTGDFFRKPVFLFHGYQAYLAGMAEANSQVRGLKARLAQAAQCQPSYLSLVLKGEAHLSLDQLYGIVRYFELTVPEWDFLRELWLLSRASSADLRAECETRIGDLRKRYGGQVGAAESLREEVDSRDYSLFGTSWHHGALYVALEVKELQTAAALAKKFALPLDRVRQVLKELAGMGLAVDRAGRWELTSRNFVMSRHSPILQMYRTAWFMKGSEVFSDHRMSTHQSGASFALSRKRFDELSKRVALLTNEIFVPPEDNDPSTVVGYIGIDLFEL